MLWSETKQMRWVTAQAGRYPELDGVRGIAVLLTILCNTIVINEEGLAGELWRRGANAGWIGVQLFFVLSGFLITEILLGSRSGPNFLRNFYARRALRIFPAYFVLLIIATFVLSRHGQHLPIHPLCYWLFLSNVCIAGAGRWVDGMVGPTWSLAVEEHFYLIWPFLIAAAPRRLLLRIAGAVVGASLLLRYAMTWYGAPSLSIYVLTPTRIDGLAAGAMIALAVHSSIAHERLRSIARWLLAVGTAIMSFVVIAARTFNYDHPLVQTVGYTALTAAGSGFILALVISQNSDQFLRRITRFGPLVRIGFYSYGMYLFHSVVLRFLLNLYGRYDELTIAGKFSLADQVAITAVVTLLTFIVAVASYYGLERHFLALRRYVSRGDPKDIPASG